MSDIRIHALHYAHAQQQILQNINLHFPAQKFSVLLGRNGSGKSTLFNLIAGLTPVQQGQILLANQPITQMKSKTKASLLGFLTQSHRSIFNFSVFDVVLTGRAAFSGYRPHPQDFELAEQALQTLEITHLKHRDYTTLSGGEKQLVMIARILTQNPKIILLDEPTNHLDVYYQAFLMQKLQLLSQQGYTIVAIMHDPNLAFLYAEQFYFMHNQQIIQPQSEQQLFAPEFLSGIYGLNFVQSTMAGKAIVMPDPQHRFTLHSTFAK